MREINNNLCRLDVSTQCTSHYPVVAATRVVPVYFYAPLFRHASPTRNKDVIAIQFRDGTTGSDFSAVICFLLAFLSLSMIKYHVMLQQFAFTLRFLCAPRMALRSCSSDQELEF